MSELDIIYVYSTPVFTIEGSKSLERVYGATYHGKSRQWRFPAFAPVYARVLADLQIVAPSIKLTPVAQEYVNSLAGPAVLPEDFQFITKPFAHQLQGTLFAYKYPRAGLFFSPGLGKCKITVDLQRLTGTKFLVLCPKVMLDTWKEEFERHGNIKDVVVISGSKKDKIKSIARAQETTPIVTVVTYTSAALYAEELIKIEYDGIIADESHQMKSPFSNRTKATQYLATRAYRRVLLSGTPSLGTPFDLYGQLRFLGKYFCAEDWWSFRKKFGVFPAYEATEKRPKIVLGYKNLDLMNERVNYVCLRKTKEECLDLEENTVIDIKFPLFSQQKKQYNDLVITRGDAVGSMLRDKMLDGELSHSDGKELSPYVIADEPITLLGKVDQISGGFLTKTTVNPRLCDGCPSAVKCSVSEVSPYTSKCTVAPKKGVTVIEPNKHNARLEQFDALIDTILEDESNKIIVWTVYHRDMDNIETVLKKRKVGYVRVDGKTSSKLLKVYRDKFNQNKECRIYLGQVATGIGVTLNAANYTVYYTLPWSLEHYLQSMDRNHRIGQTRKVTTYRLIAHYTIDEAKAAALDQKLDFSNLITSKHVCATCPEFARRCVKYGIKPFDDDCIHDKEVIRETASIRTIP